ncbi:MAG: diaminopimelate epimerase [Acidiferrobacterales bacterium]
MRIPFTKMHGLGNDFVVFDGVAGKVTFTPGQIRWIAQRRFGIGCDQVLIVERTHTDGVDFSFRIFNADGSEVEQCGNGARCLARYVRDHGYTDKNEIAMESLAGMIALKVEADGQVTADMGVPEFDPERIPFEAETQQIVYDLDIGGHDVEVSVLSLGNPHAVQVVEDLSDALVVSQGPAIENHLRFPKRVNAGFMQVVDSRHIRLRVHERGVGETLACGSGACAAMIAGRQRGLLGERVQVTLLGGTLEVSWRGDGEPVFMTGAAVTSYDGIIGLDAL